MLLATILGFGENTDRIYAYDCYSSILTAGM